MMMEVIWLFQITTHFISSHLFFCPEYVRPIFRGTIRSQMLLSGVWMPTGMEIDWPASFAGRKKHAKVESRLQMSVFGPFANERDWFCWGSIEQSERLMVVGIFRINFETFGKRDRSANARPSKGIYDRHTHTQKYHSIEPFARTEPIWKKTQLKISHSSLHWYRAHVSNTFERQRDARKGEHVWCRRMHTAGIKRVDMRTKP